MKTLKLFPLAILTIVLLFAACSKENQKDHKKVIVPEAVKKAFNEKFPKAKQVEWGMEDQDFEADFDNESIETSVVMDKNGAILVTETAMKKEDLPANITAAISEKYAGSTIKKAEKLVNKDGTFYEVELKTSNSEVEVLFNNEGAVVKVEDDDDDDDDNNEYEDNDND